MTPRVISLFAASVFCVTALTATPEEVAIPPGPSPEEIARAPSFGPGDRIVATHYFYWYRWPDEHFFDDPLPGGKAAAHAAGRKGYRHDILRHHFPDHQQVSYESPAWHRRQMEDMLAAGIDVALCVYWGAPNQYAKRDLRFSIAGLPPLVAALDELAERGPTPRIGLFYDTSTLLAQHAFAEPRSRNVDLRTEEGRDIFYRTIRDFFRLVPPRHWACIDGRPLVQLYNAAFAVGHDQGTIDYVYERFAQDFAGRRPFIIAGPSWSLQADASTGWGAAVWGPIIGTELAQVGPGYDDSPVPGRTTPTRDRLGGGFYAASWLLAIQSRPRMVTIETWSEMHEGTGICESLEDGRYYIDLTRRYSDMFKAGRQPTGDEWAEAVKRMLHAPSSQRWGREFAGQMSIGWSVGNKGQVSESGLRLCRGVADGACSVQQVADTACLRSGPALGDNRYIYFDLADPYYYDHRGDLRVSFTYYDEGRDPIALQYDSVDQNLPMSGSYREHPRRITRTDTGTWKTATLNLTAARCANRQNGGADFRFHSPGAELAIRSITVSKLPPDYAP